MNFSVWKAKNVIKELKVWCKKQNWKRSLFVVDD